MAVLEAYAGDPLPLALSLSDGATDKFPRATIFNGGTSPVPVDTVDLDHKALGLYRADWTGSAVAPGNYFAVYRVFTDSGRTVEADYTRVMDSITILPYDRPRLGVAYDNVSDTLIMEAFLSKGGGQVPSSELLTADLFVFDSDDNLLFSPVTDLAPDGEGVFRFSQPSPGLTADRLYVVRVTVNTSTGAVTGQQGFAVTE